MNNLTQDKKSEDPEISSSFDTKSRLSPIRYRNWLISTKVIDGKLWLQWQHPAESFPRYNHPISEKGLSETIRHVRFMIDLAIKLEQDAAKHALPCKQSSLEKAERLGE